MDRDIDMRVGIEKLLEGLRDGVAFKGQSSYACMLHRHLSNVLAEMDRAPAEAMQSLRLLMVELNRRGWGESALYDTCSRRRRLQSRNGREIVSTLGPAAPGSGV